MTIILASPRSDAARLENECSSVEMRHSVTTPGYRFRKALDNLLYSLNWKHVTAKDVEQPLADKTFVNSPSGWLPLYTMVTFRPDISYSAVQRKYQQQSHTLGIAAWLSAGVAVGAVGITCVTLLRRLCNRT